MPKPAPFYAPLSADAVKQLALEIISGEVFGSWNLTDGTEPELCFLPLVFLEKRHLKDIKRHALSHCYEYMKRAGKMAINGHPTFYSCRWLSQTDFERVRACVGKMRIVLDEVKADA